MPNIQVQNIDTLKFPYQTKDFALNNLYKSNKTTNKFILEVNDEFIIQINQKENTFCIKADKLTMPPVHTVHKCLQNMIDEFGLDVKFSNIAQKSQRVKNFEYLKNIEYFYNEFKTNKKIWVEVGFGSGRHLLHQAINNPDVQFIGIEIHKYSIEQVLKQIKLQNIKNLLIIDYDARTFLEFLDSNSVEKIFVHFPVPWDKKPHRRVINTNFINETSRVLMPNGKLHLRTDSIKYYQYCYNLFINMNKINMKIMKNQDLEIVSKYEDRWKKMEKNIFDIYYLNELSSPKQNKKQPLSFDLTHNKINIKKNFKEETIVEQEFFIHFEELFFNDNNDLMIRVSFGSMQNHEHKYIQITDTQTKFFHENILPTALNQKAFDKICELLQKLNKG